MPASGLPATRSGLAESQAITTRSDLPSSSSAQAAASTRPMPSWNRRHACEGIFTHCSTLFLFAFRVRHQANQATTGPLAANAYSLVIGLSNL